MDKMAKLYSGIKGTVEYELMIHAIEDCVKQTKAHLDSSEYQQMEDHMKQGTRLWIDGAVAAYGQAHEILTGFMKQQIARDEHIMKEITAEEAAEQDARDLKAYAQAVL